MTRRTLIGFALLSVLILPRSVSAQTVRFYASPLTAGPMGSLYTTAALAGLNIVNPLPANDPNKAISVQIKADVFENFGITAIRTTAANHAAIAATDGVLQIPANLNTTVGGTAAMVASGLLETAKIPGAWIVVGLTTWYQVLFEVLHNMPMRECLRGMVRQRTFENISLDNELQNRSTVQNRLLTCAVNTGYDASVILGGTQTIRQALRALAAAPPRPIVMLDVVF